MIKEINFSEVLKFKRFHLKMENAVRLVVLGKFTYAEAARRLNVSRQAVHKAVRSFRKTSDSLGADL